MQQKFRNSLSWEYSLESWAWISEHSKNLMHTTTGIQVLSGNVNITEIKYKPLRLWKKI